MKYMIGWFGVPGLEHYSTKTHIVDENQKPVCGCILNNSQQFQQCKHWSLTENSPFFDSYLECGHCKKWSIKRLEEKIEKLKKLSKEYLQDIRTETEIN